MLKKNELRSHINPVNGPHHFRRLCFACGGYPKPTSLNGSLGHKFEDPVPSLFTFNIPQNPITT